MDEIVKRVCERLAARSSRAGFFAVLAKVALGATALASGQGWVQEAEASGPPPLVCCMGTACYPGNSNVFPAGAGDQCAALGYWAGYSWYCHNGHGTRYICRDCYSGSPSTGSTYECTYVIAR